MKSRSISPIISSDGFTRPEINLMRNQDIHFLDDDIGVTRVMIFRTVVKMNEVRDQLTFHDYLQALRSVAYAGGRISSMVQVREELFRPYEEIQKKYQQNLNGIKQTIAEWCEKLFGKDKWEEIMFGVELDLKGEENGHLKSPRPKKMELQ